jgi:hypothetical protein
MFLGVYFASRKQIARNILASGIAFAVNVGLNITLIPRLGVIGAGIGTSASLTLWTLILVAFFVRQEKSAIRDLFIITGEDITAYKGKIVELKAKLRGLHRKASGDHGAEKLPPTGGDEGTAPPNGDTR